MTEPCPFCGSDDVAIEIWLEVFRVECKACGASGPTGSHKDEAFLVWNIRPKEANQ